MNINFSSVHRTMAAGWFCVVSLSLVLLGQSVLVGAENYRRRHGDHHHKGDGDRHHGKCHKLTKALGQACEVKEDCTNITCASSFGGQQVLLSAVIECWGPSVDLTVRVPELGIDWSHRFRSGDSISIPKFPLEIDGVLTAQVNVTVELEEVREHKLRVKVQLLGGGEVAGEEVFPLKQTVMDGELPIDCPEPEIIGCGPWVREKWRRLPWQARAAIVAGSLLFLMLLVSLCCFLYKKPTKQGKTPPKVFVKPSPDIMTTTKSKVPLEPLTSDA